MRLITHPATEKIIQNFLAKPAHGLLITGSPDAGKAHVAKYITASILDKPLDKLGSYPYFKILEAVDGKPAGIDDIRQLKQFLRLKTAGTHQLRRFIIIVDAHELGHEAQNAMLKFLEEPPADTCIILTSSEPNKLKPTILSRLQTIRIHNLSKQHLEAIIEDSSQIDRLHALSDGAVSRLLKLNGQNDSADPTKYLDDAKDLINGTRLQRLAKIDRIVKDTGYDAGLLLDNLYRIINAKFKAVSAGNDTTAVKVLHSKMDKTHRAQKLLSQNVQPKLALTELFYDL
jgi:DNA polymerase-3 subunit delta'